MRKEFRDLASVDEAREVAERLTPDGRAVEVGLREARGRVLAEDLDSPVDVPGFDRSLMDGYAVRAEDTYGATEADPSVLAVVGEVSAGEPPEVEVGEGEAAAIPTGAPIPDGADAVVPVERASRDGDRVRIQTAVAPADSVMFAGSDIAAGERALSAGTRLSQRELGLAAAVGAERVSVYTRPRVGVVSTGDELVRPGGDLSEGRIYDVNTFSVSAAVEEAGGEAVVYEHVRDDYDRMVEVVRAAASECDIVLSSGSTSASDEDVVYRVVEEEGELVLHGVSLKPGRPTVFGRVDGTPFVGLPGNPISALSVFRMFVSDMVRGAAGGRDDGDETVGATVATEVRTEGGRTRLLPVGLVEDGDGSVLAYSVDKGSGATTSLARADGYVTVEPSRNYLDEGDRVEVSLFGGARVPELVGAGEDVPPVRDLVGGREGRWLPVGSVEGVRRVREGVADVAVVDIPAERVDALGVSGARLIRGYEREVGYAYRGDIDDAEVFGVLPEGYGLRRMFDDDRDRDADIRVFRSERGIVNAVGSDRVDAGLCGRGEAEGTDLRFTRVGTGAVDLLVSDAREGKRGVGSFVDGFGSIDAEGYVGYASHEDTGEVVAEWGSGG